MQDLNTSCLCNRANSIGKYGSTTAAKSRSETNSANVEMLWKQLCARDYTCWKAGAEEEALKCNGYSGDIELGDEPEQELEANGDGEIDLSRKISLSR